MMHEAYAKIDIFFEGFIEVNCKHCRGTWFYLKMFAIGFVHLRCLQKTRLNPSIFDGKTCLCMDACMHDYAKALDVV